MKPQITDIQSVLSAKEFKRFGNFLRSPFFNIEERFIRVYDILEDKNATLETIAERFFGSKSFTGELRFRKLVSEFMKIFSRFLSELEYEKDEYRQRIMLIKQYSARNLKEAYNREANRAESAIDTGGIKDEEYYRKMLELYSLRYQAEGFNYSSWESDLSFKVDEHLNKYFADMKMFLYQRFQSMEYIYIQDKKIEKTFLEIINSYIVENKEKLIAEHSDIYLRYLMYLMIANPSQQSITDEYLNLINSFEGTSNINCRTYYEDLMNYYTLLVNSGKREFENNIIHLAEIMDNRNYFKENIAPNEYKIIIEAAIGAKNFNWAEEFAEKNKDYLIHKYRQSIYSVCMAKINFLKNDFRKARAYSSQVVYDDFMYYLEAKLIECRILYCEKNISELLMVIETSKKYLNTHREIGSQHKESYSFFLNFLKKLSSIYESKLASKDVNFEIRKLEDEINSCKGLLYGIQWLEKNLDELK
ncbi:MAG: hypothetical protein IT281_05680 [Ignavibacteria bacterium]|nr:hypothetical protein [Ignavibacteria bacterium]MCC7159008.1 hypothetical protein [Ignavibacteria bacterium]